MKKEQIEILDLDEEENKSLQKTTKKNKFDKEYFFILGLTIVTIILLIVMIMNKKG